MSTNDDARLLPPMTGEPTSPSAIRDIEILLAWMRLTPDEKAEAWRRIEADPELRPRSAP